MSGKRVNQALGLQSSAFASLSELRVPAPEAVEQGGHESHNRGQRLARGLSNDADSSEIKFGKYGLPQVAPCLLPILAPASLQFRIRGVDDFLYLSGHLEFLRCHGPSNCVDGMCGPRGNVPNGHSVRRNLVANARVWSNS